MNTYFYKALQEIKPIQPPINKNSIDLFNYFTENDPTIKPNRFLTKPKPKQIQKENLDDIYTNRTVICPKCKNNETYRDNKQTRSSDEGETFFFVCKYCKHRIKT